ncbi:hypothetical protein P167DRAFT_122059 [Morchella conica CCBAS932]|uniref:Uncharacterized protein n=1 Tax=Morchella conica CCBAS932 TaxID=1392247 RepID=A0A3N4L2Z6_9PEZI|nr:hypothetical protein P167DRAFT_122059 [Morchella conica CCBAS932]
MRGQHLLLTAVAAFRMALPVSHLQELQLSSDFEAADVRVGSLIYTYPALSILSACSACHIAPLLFVVDLKSYSCLVIAGSLPDVSIEVYLQLSFVYGVVALLL